MVKWILWKEEERTRRLARPLCFVRSDPIDNGYAHPIEGLRPIVDLNRSKKNRELFSENSNYNVLFYS